MSKNELKNILLNRKAAFDYILLDKYEAGIMLKGTEVKSIREGKVNLSDGFARVDNNEIFLYNMHVSPYSHGNISNVDPLRKRKLLLNKAEINRLIGRLSQGNMTLVPLRLYLKGNKVKLEISLAKRKKVYDKRESIKKKDAEREIRSKLKDSNRKGGVI